MSEIKSNEELSILPEDYKEMDQLGLTNIQRAVTNPTQFMALTQSRLTSPRPSNSEDKFAIDKMMHKTMTNHQGSSFEDIRAS